MKQFSNVHTNLNCTHKSLVYHYKCRNNRYKNVRKGYTIGLSFTFEYRTHKGYWGSMFKGFTLINKNQSKIDIFFPQFSLKHVVMAESHIPNTRN